MSGACSLGVLSTGWGWGWGCGAPPALGASEPACGFPDPPFADCSPQSRAAEILSSSINWRATEVGSPRTQTRFRPSSSPQGLPRMQPTPHHAVSSAAEGHQESSGSQVLEPIICRNHSSDTSRVELHSERADT